MGDASPLGVPLSDGGAVGVVGVVVGVVLGVGLAVWLGGVAVDVGEGAVGEDSSVGRGDDVAVGLRDGDGVGVSGTNEAAGAGVP